MKVLSFITSLLFSITVIAKDPAIVAEKPIDHGALIDEHIKNTYKRYVDESIKDLQLLFIKDKKELKILFPEFEIEDLLAKIKELKVDIVAEALIDKNGEKKTCLNFPDLSIIQCSSKELDTFFNYQESLYVLLLHEILGLIRIEETSSSEPNFLNSYLISKRIAKYVTRAGAYDFVLDRSSVNGFEFSMEQRVFKYSKERNTLGLNLRILYPTEKELIKGALKYVREECEMERKKITYMDGHAFDVKRGPDDCELKRHCISTSGTIFVRYICE